MNTGKFRVPRSGTAAALNGGAAAIMIFLVGCASKSTVAFAPVYYDKIPVRTTDAVLGPQLVEAYPISRYQDPQNPDLMHERHIVYRRINRGWRLRSNPGEEIQLGATVGPRNAGYQPRPARGEVNAAVVSQRYQLAQSEETLSQVRQQLAELQQVAPTVNGVVQNQQAEIARLQALEERLIKLEGRQHTNGSTPQPSPTSTSPNEPFERSALSPSPSPSNLPTSTASPSSSQSPDQ
jgi:hypothetical protein